MIRPTTEADAPILTALAADTGAFKPHEIEALAEVLADYFAANVELSHSCVTMEMDGAVRGFAYWAPAAMTDRTWYLYWIAVDKSEQGRGLGGELLRHVEQQIWSAGGRLLLIETSSLPGYGLTRQFYVKHGYRREAVVRGFYADGDDMVIFSKPRPG